MLNLSNCKIHLGKSATYARILSLINILALFLLLQSAIYLPIKLLLAFYMCIYLIRILKHSLPYPDYLMLSYEQSSWILELKNKQTEHYQRLRIIIDAKLFLLVELKTMNKIKNLVIFDDQISAESYRLLNIINNIKKA